MSSDIRLSRQSCVVVAVVLGAASAVLASPEERCQGNRYVAAGNYARCQQKAAGKYYANGSVDVAKYQQAANKCADVYATTWLRLQGRALGTGSTCDAGRFVDNGDGTVTDKLTGLQWEKKTDDATIHDKDERYARRTAGFDAKGGTYKTFLAG